MAIHIKSAGFVPLSPRVALVGLNTGEIVVLERPLRMMSGPAGELWYCTAKREDGPIFDGRGQCMNGHEVQAVNYVEVGDND